MGAELVVADLTNGADVVRALRGCKRMYFGMSISSSYLQAAAIGAAEQKKSRLRDSREHLANDSFADESNCNDRITSATTTLARRASP